MAKDTKPAAAPKADAKKEVKVDGKVFKTHQNKMRRLAKHIKEFPLDKAAAEQLVRLKAAPHHSVRKAPRSHKWGPLDIVLAQTAAKLGYRGNAALRWGQSTDSYPYAGARYGVGIADDGKVIILAAGEKWDQYKEQLALRHKAEEAEARSKAAEEAKAQHQKNEEERRARLGNRKPGHQKGKPGDKRAEGGEGRPKFTNKRPHNAKPAPKKESN